MAAKQNGRSAGSKNIVSNRRLTIDLPADLHLRLKIHCAKSGVTMNDFIRACLEKKVPQEV